MRTFVCRFILPSWLALASLGPIGLAQPDQARNVFEERYQRWKSWRNDHRHLYFDTHNQKYQDIIALGPQCIPFLIEKMERNFDEDFLLEVAVWKIAKKRFEKTEWPEGKRGEAQTKARMLIHWWKEGRFKTEERLGELHSQWNSLKAEDRTEEARETYRKIVDLGIAALPYLIDKVEQQPELIPAISKLTGGALPATATAADCRQWWSKNRQQFELPSQ